MHRAHSHIAHYRRLYGVRVWECNATGKARDRFLMYEIEAFIIFHYY